MPVTANYTMTKARQLQRALYVAAKRSAKRRFHALYDKVHREDILARAWAEVKAKGGAAGVDGQTLAEIEDRGVEQATRLVLEPIFEADFRDCSFGFRPQRSAHQALERIRVTVNRGARWVV